MNDKTFYIILTVLVIALAGGAVVYNKKYGSGDGAPGLYDGFAQCLTDSGAKFYGAFWCPHCQNQKKQFGTAQKYLPYIECSTPDSKGQTQVCADAKIVSYPTWVFADGTTQSGEVSMARLAELTSCTLPQPVN